MNRRSVLLAAGAASAASAQNLKFSKRRPWEPFIGGWSLVSFERLVTGGEISYPFGQDAVGRIAYDGLFRMSAQIMRRNRPKFTSSDRSTASTEETKTAYDGYIAYYGTFSVDDARRTVIHHVEAALFPNWVGTDLERQYEFTGRNLVLHAKSGTGENRLIWERARLR